jgi:hypothetical protein
MDNEQFIKIMRRWFGGYVDELWGPIGPHVRPKALPRELAAAFRVAQTADLLEAAQDGLGVSLMARFSDEPEGICLERKVPHIGPHGGGDPEPEPPYDLSVVGAALVFVAGSLTNKEVSGAAVSGGMRLLEKE